MRTWMMNWDGSARGLGWKITPVQPWVSSLRLKLRAATVSANAKNPVSAAPGRPEALLQQPVLVLRHAFQTLAAHVAPGRAVDGVAERHVVGGDGLGHGARRPAHPEEPTGHLLAGADLREHTVLGWVQVDLEGVLVGVEHRGLRSRPGPSGHGGG
jgi:hypothetical protein